MTADAPTVVPPASRVRAAFIGLLGAAVAIGVAELAAGLLQVVSIVVAVGDGVIAASPPAISEFAIGALGGLNRTALVTGTLVVLGLASLAIGVLAARRFAYGVAGIGALAGVGLVAAVVDPQDPVVRSALPGLAAFAAGTAALWCALPATRAAADAPTDGSRRSLLRAAGVLSVAAVATVATGRWLAERASAAVERAELALRGPDRPATPVPAGADYELGGLTPYMTPNDEFYRIDTAVQVPNLRVGEWRLRIHGLVDRELELTFEDLLDRELVEADITLACVSNEIGGDLVGNARWLGVRLDDLLAECGVAEDATQLVGRSVDGYTGGFPVADAIDGRDALLAVAMNGEPLPLEHGYPVRIIVPGLFGYVSAVKWLTELELTTFDAFDHYWERRDWAEQAPIKTQARIDRPRGLADLSAGEYVIAGVAWAPTRGIERVEVGIDGQWRDAELAEVVSQDTWRQWRYAWDAEPGFHQLQVRATDGTGATQSEERVDPIPDGAEGWHTISVQVGNEDSEG